MKRKTIYDVARDADVSISTVSRVINGKGYVSEEKRKRVEQACKDYYPIASAREIQSQKSKTIGIIINHRADYFFMNGTFLNALNGIATEAQSRGYRLLLEITPQEMEVCNLYHERRVDGLLIMGCQESSQLIPKMVQEEIPFVLIGDYKESDSISQVEINDRQAVAEAVRYLIGMGHDRIGIITGSLNFASGVNRLQGYMDAHEEAGIVVQDELIACCDAMTDLAAENLTKKLLYLQNPITALVAFNDMVAVAAYKAAKEMQIVIGKELSVIGFDDDRIATYVTPALTTIWQPSYEKGKKAAEILLDAVENEVLPSKREELKCMIIYRDSCAEMK